MGETTTPLRKNSSSLRVGGGLGPKASQASFPSLTDTATSSTSGEPTPADGGSLCSEPPETSSKRFEITTERLSAKQENEELVALKAMISAASLVADAMQDVSHVNALQQGSKHPNGAKQPAAARCQAANVARPSAIAELA